MAENSSSAGGEILPRLVEESVSRSLRVNPVVILQGLRQVGKSTLANKFAAEGFQQFNLDEPELLKQLRKSSAKEIRNAPSAIIDEIQRMPELLLILKKAIDAEGTNRRMGRFMVTSSASPFLDASRTDSLTGRASYVRVGPMTRREKLGRGSCGLWSELLDTPLDEWEELIRSDSALPVDWRAEVRRGGLPTPALQLKDDESRSFWFEGYLARHLAGDLREISKVAERPDYRRLMEIACQRLGSIMNEDEMGSTAKLPKTTAHRYLNLMEEASFMLVRLHPYIPSRTRRLVKSPRLYWTDTGIALHLSGLAEPTGAYLENLVLNDLLAWRSVQAPRTEVMYWRTSNGSAEVDFVIEQRGKLLPIEIKSAKNPGTDDAKGLHTFIEDYSDQAAAGLVLHGGEKVVRLTSNVLAAPWWRVL